MDRRQGARIERIRACLPVREDLELLEFGWSVRYIPSSFSSFLLTTFVTSRLPNEAENCRGPPSPVRPRVVAFRQVVARTFCSRDDFPGDTPEKNLRGRKGRDARQGRRGRLGGSISSCGINPVLNLPTKKQQRKHQPETGLAKWPQAGRWPLDPALPCCLLEHVRPAPVPPWDTTTDETG